MKLKKSLLPVTLALALSSALLLTGCDDQNAGNGKKDSPPEKIKVFKVEPLIYTVKVELPARVVASQIAEIRPQVSGIILKKEFEESSNISIGQSLYQIDPAIYQANYDSALASVASAKASANIAHLTLNRYAGLLKTKSISQQDYDKSAADAQQADAGVLVAEANLHTAKVNLDYTKVYSPIEGYIGKSSVTEGALVSAGQPTPLALVQKLDPIYIDMTEAAIQYNKNKADSGVIYKPNEKVEIFFSDGSKYKYDGHIKFSEMTVSETTGTVNLRAEFPNPDTTILPGMFLKPKLELGIIENAILVPQKGITSNEKGNYTAIVAIPLEKNQDPSATPAQSDIANSSTATNTADAKDGTQYYLVKRDNIKIYTGMAGYWIVTDGINAGERVVISGLLNLTAKNFNDPENKVMATILDTSTLSQSELDTLVTDSSK